MSKVIGIHDLTVFQTRVLCWYNKEHKYIAQSLETGKVTTAPTRRAVRDNMLELLSEELKTALTHAEFQPLMSNPAPYDLWMDWLSAVHKGREVEDHAVETVDGLRLLVRMVYET